MAFFKWDANPVQERNKTTEDKWKKPFITFHFTILTLCCKHNYENLCHNIIAGLSNFLAVLRAYNSSLS